MPPYDSFFPENPNDVKEAMDIFIKDVACHLERATVEVLESVSNWQSSLDSNPLGYFLDAFQGSQVSRKRGRDTEGYKSSPFTSPHDIKFVHSSILMKADTSLNIRDASLLNKVPCLRDLALLLTHHLPPRHNSFE
jgi:hypothetical protein